MQSIHLFTIGAFVILFWRGEIGSRWAIRIGMDFWGTVLLAGAPPILAGLACFISQRHIRGKIERPSASSERTYRAFLNLTLGLRAGVLLSFGFLAMLTPWPDWFAFRQIHPVMQIFGDLIALSPFLVGLVLIWIASFPLERSLRRAWANPMIAASPHSPPGDWTLREYLDFHIRHQLLTVAAPMAIILLASDLTRGYSDRLAVMSGIPWADDSLLAVVAMAVFVVTPVLLRYLWQTHPLEAGPLRDELLATCCRIGLHIKDILVWRSDGTMVNAAVMGLFPPVRYVLLSDALLRAMSLEQIEAVFGHEAGHVKHRHIQYFLAFALTGWLAVAGMMEWLAYFFSNPNGDSTLRASHLGIDGIGILATVLFWAIGFGRLSRRFEHQADLFGARCASPEAPDCHLPCSVHLDSNTTLPGTDRVCATGVAVFASALTHVAQLNAIPIEEHHWRHASIGSRIHFLTSLAGDSAQASRFQRTTRRIKATIATLAVIGSLLALLYTWRLLNGG